MKFAKPALRLEEQLEQLSKRGLRIDDAHAAIHALKHHNYYRLRGYWIVLEQPTSDGLHKFRPGADLQTALNLYRFDEQLRSLLMEAVASIEVSVRTQFAYQIAVSHGPHAYLDQNLFDDPVKHADCLAKLHEEVGRSHEVFIRHYLEKYSTPDLPPLWAVCEVMSLGALSKWFSNLANRSDRKRIADEYDVDETTLVSFLRHLTVLRNHCAHHGRVWNRRFTVTMRVPRNRPVRAARAFEHGQDESRRIYNTLTMIGHFMNVIEPSNDWLSRVRSTIERTSMLEPAAMGFPLDWKGRQLWREAAS